jgi:hypothetical protein
LNPGAWSDRTISPVRVSTIPATAMPIPRSGDAAFAVTSRNRLVSRPAIRSWFFLDGRTRMAALDVTSPPAVTTAACAPSGSMRTAPTGHPALENQTGLARLPPRAPLASGACSSSSPPSKRRDIRPIVARVEPVSRRALAGRAAVGVERLQHPSTADRPVGKRKHRHWRADPAATGLQDLPVSNRSHSEADVVSQ